MTELSPRKPRRTKLKQMIQKRGMKQYQLAKLADMQIYQVSQLASGKQTDLMLSTAGRICNALNCTLDEAFSDLI